MKFRSKRAATRKNKTETLRSVLRLQFRTHHADQNVIFKIVHSNPDANYANETGIKFNDHLTRSAYKYRIFNKFTFLFEYRDSVVIFLCSYSCRVLWNAVQRIWVFVTSLSGYIKEISSSTLALDQLRSEHDSLPCNSSNSAKKYTPL